MVTTTTQNLEYAGRALGVYFDTKVIESLQPHLYFEQFGTVEIVPEGNYTSRFFTFNQIATGAVVGLTEGTAPTSTAVSVNAIDVTPTQYGINVEMTDLVALTCVFDLVKASLSEVGKAMARKIDEVIQTVVNAGGNVIFPAGRFARDQLTSSDRISVDLIFKAVQMLRTFSAPEFPGGGYACVMHPRVAYDLMTSAGPGASYWEMHKYAQPENLFRGEIGSIAGARIVQSPNVKPFYIDPTIVVYPTTLIAADAYRICYWLGKKVNTYVYPPESAVSISNPLGQKGWVGAKTNIGVARTQEDRLVRIETAASVL